MKKILTALALLSCSPSLAHSLEPSLFSKTIELCRMDLQMYMKGDKTWIERQIARFREEDQNYVLGVCAAYGQGLIDGMKVKPATRA